ncbi:hypothetical protein SGFS_063610 [Streptomyces graminofaciens]|uniref:Uncharacterized protein n=1 Tax=Streptomyces graminofaciens TaxID=68212 RepID=A0ABM7FDE7_9ACTN|nr:hypothetical protein SGFS_063610 [Streptomyces graminofaciens]
MWAIWFRAAVRALTAERAALCRARGEDLLDPPVGRDRRVRLRSGEAVAQASLSADSRPARRAWDVHTMSTPCPYATYRAGTPPYPRPGISEQPSPARTLAHRQTNCPW